MSITSYDSLNNIPDIYLDAGSEQVLSFTCYDNDGLTLLTITGGSVVWYLCPYGDYETKTLQKSGSITGAHTFTVTLTPADTVSLGGKYIQQMRIIDASGNTFRPGQGNVVISNAISGATIPTTPQEFLDESGKIWTPTNVPIDIITTSTYELGGASALSPDGFYGRIWTANSNDFALGNGDWTWDFWVNFADFNTDNIFAQVYQTDNGGNNEIYYDIDIEMTDENTWVIGFFFHDRTTNPYTAMLFYCEVTNSSLAPGTWHHVAVSRYGDIPLLFLDGITQTNLGDASFNGLFIAPINGPLQVLDTTQNYDSTYATSVLMDEVRFSNIARWTDNFTVPISEYALDANTVILLHMNGVNNSTTFTDETGRFWSSQLNPIIVPDQYKFGNGSYYKPIYSVNNYYGATVNPYLETQDSPDWYLGNNDWTFDFWVKYATVSNNDYIIFIQGMDNLNGSGTDYFYIYMDQGYIGAYCINGGIPIFYFYTSWALSINTWYHIAIERYGSTPLIFVDGISQSVTEDTTISGKTAADLSDSVQFQGMEFCYYDEFRFSNGIARWTTDFTVPSSPYTMDAYTKVLFHFNKNT